MIGHETRSVAHLLPRILFCLQAPSPPPPPRPSPPPPVAGPPPSTWQSAPIPRTSHGSGGRRLFQDADVAPPQQPESIGVQGEAPQESQPASVSHSSQAMQPSASGARASVPASMPTALQQQLFFDGVRSSSFCRVGVGPCVVLHAGRPLSCCFLQTLPCVCSLATESEASPRSAGTAFPGFCLQQTILHTLW